MVLSRMPYQCMAKLGTVLIAARGSSIDCLNIIDGSLLSTWNCPPTRESSDRKPLVPTVELKSALQKSELSSVESVLDFPPPAKKRRLSTDGDGIPTTGEQKALVKEGKKKQNNRSDAVASGLESPAVIALAVTQDGKHVVAVTGEDKCIRVFDCVSSAGQPALKQLSQRIMPKRPCAITITTDNTTIISADKFGDVYSLPLTPSTAPPLMATQISPSPTTAPKPFTPAANEFTIHSERNRKALENQRRQTNQKPDKVEPGFEHALLLGHVSMLTDVVLGEVNGRKYILTADRDEHIRVSRGIPQTYVIEGFCLGHTEFVSRLCVPSTCPEVLISGGGDDELVVWEWLAGRRISAVDISSHINEVLEGRSETIKPAISSIQHMLQNATNTDIIVVASEGIPALFIFKLLLTPHPHIQHTQTITLPGNVLSVVLVEGHEERILVSIDTIHKPCSTCERREENDAPDSIFLLTSHGEKFVLCETVVKAPEIMDVDFEKAAVGRLGNLLYSLENLRKREGDGTDD